MGKLDPWDLKGLLERLVLRACGGSPVLWVNKDSLVPLAKTALLDLLDPLDSSV